METMLKTPTVEIFVAWLNALDDKEFWQAIHAMGKVAAERTGDEFWYL